MKIKINLTVPNFSAIQSGLNDVINSTGQKATELVNDTAKNKAPVHFGNLRRSIYPQVNASVGKFTGKVIQDGSVASYGVYVEKGTGIYGLNKSPIVPKTKPFLQWRDYGGQWHRAKQIKGQKPQPFMKPALDDNKDTIKQMFKDNISEYLGGSK